MRTSAIREMSRLAIQHGAVNLSQGFPDFPAPEAMKQAAVEAILRDENQYSDDWGTESIRAAISREYQRRVGPEWSPHSEVTVTCGSTEALFATTLSVLQPGDEVVIIEPYYENYVHAIGRSGATPVCVPLSRPSWSLDLERLGAAFSNRTRAIIVNSPHNPTGGVLTAEELQEIARLCCRYDAIAISDEIYRHLVYDGRAFVSISQLPGMQERSVVVDGLSKAYGVTGWRVGWSLAPSRISVQIREAHTQLTLGAPTPFQEAGVVGLIMPDAYYTDLKDKYVSLRDILSDGLTRLGFEHETPPGAFYIMTRFPDLDVEAYDYCVRLVLGAGVAGVPGSSFFSSPVDGQRLVRFSFSKSAAVLAEAIGRLSTWYADR